MMSWEIDPAWVIGGFTAMFGALTLGGTKAFNYVIKQQEEEKAERKAERAEFLTALKDCEEKHQQKDIDYAELQGKVSVLQSMANLPQAVATAVVEALKARGS